MAPPARPGTHALQVSPARCPAEQGSSTHASLCASVSPLPGFAVPLGHRYLCVRALGCPVHPLA